MTVTSLITRKEFIGNGLTTEFSLVPMRVFSAAELTVTVAGVAVPSFTFVADGAGSGEVLITPAPANGAAVIIDANPSFEQQIDYENEGPYLPETQNEGLDRSAARDLILRRDTQRAVKAPRGEIMGDLPSASARAGRFFAFDGGGNPSMASGTGADSALRADLAAAGGANLVRAPGWANRSVGAKLSDIPTSPTYGTIGNGVTDESAALQRMFDDGGGFMTPGVYGIGSPVIIKPGMQVICHPDATFIPLVNNIDMFRVDDAQNAFRWGWSGGRFEPAGRTGVNVFSLRQAHLHGRIDQAHIVGAFAKAIFLRELCWDMDLWGNYVSGCDIGIDVDAGSNGVRIWGGTYENFTSRGIRVQTGTVPLPVVCVDIRRATVQFGPVGIEDKARGTIMSNVYAEGCTEADIYLNGAIGSVVEYGYHSAITGPVCVKGRNALGCHVFYPRLQGDRSVGIFDFDGTNASCTYELNQQASLGAPRGITTGIHSKENLNGNPEVSDLGTDAASRPRIGALLGGTVIMRPVDNSLGPVPAVGLSVNAAQAADAFYREVSAGENLEVTTHADDQRLTFYLKLVAGYTTGTVSVGGVALDMTGAAAGKRKKVEARKIAADGGYVWISESAWK